MRHPLPALALSLALLPGLAGARETATPSEPAEATVYRYAVTTNQFGEIGTYENRIIRQGQQTVVETEIDIEVKVLFVSAFSLEASRRETWQQGRLVAFEGTTQKNGDTLALSGRAEGDRFLIDGPLGEGSAPGDVATLNPWSMQVTRSTTVMSPESGRTWPITIGAVEEKSLDFQGESVPVTHYTILGEDDPELWFDAQGRPLRFTINEEGRELRFDLVSAETVALAATAPGPAARP